MYSIRFQLEISLDSPWHVGTGLSRGLIDRTTQRNGQGDVYVPASTVKGRLRNACEHVARIYASEGSKLVPCQPPRPDRMCRGTDACIVYSVFGSAYLGERLYFEDARMISESRDLYEPRFQSQPRTRVKLDRRLGTAERGHLFTSEYAETALAFNTGVSGRLDLTSSDGDSGHAYELILLAAGVGFVKELGGDKSSGFGRCEISFVDGIRVNDKSVSPSDLVEMIDDLEYYGIG
jgi:CRISPR/Cas system CSM-associated protein Csm3 (group 7 of RAMP superfamily)